MWLRIGAREGEDVGGRGGWWWRRVKRERKFERIKERYWKSHEDARETRGRGTSLIRV